MEKFKATITYSIELEDIEWNDLYLDHMGITGLNEQLSRNEIVHRLKEGMYLEFISEIVSGATTIGDLSGTLYFGYRTNEQGSYEVIVDDEPWWRYPSISNNDLKLLGTDDWWKEHDIESESDVAIGRVVYSSAVTGWDYEGI